MREIRKKERVMKGGERDRHRQRENPRKMEINETGERERERERKRKIGILIQPFSIVCCSLLSLIFIWFTRCQLPSQEIFYESNTLNNRAVPTLLEPH